MKKLTLILLMLLLTSFSFAHDENVPHYVNMENSAGLVNPDGFFEYMIVKGDYLWMLADRFYNDPYQWTEIRGANPYIVDPDWIYPNNWLVIPNVFTDESGKPILSSTSGATGTKTWSEESSTWEETSKTWGGTESTSLVAKDNEGNIIYENGDPSVIEGFGIDSDSDGVIDGYDTDGDGQIDIAVNDALTLAEYNSAKAETDAKAAETKTAEDAAAALVAAQEKKDCESYCGKPGWKLGLHASYPIGGGPDGENLNLGLLLGTPLGVRVGPLSVGLGAGAFTYDFDKFYFGGGLLASLCLNDLLKLDMPLVLQLHGVGFYIFGEDQGLGIGVIGSGTVPLGKTPLSLGLYGALGKYYPADNNYSWSNIGAVLFYAL